MTYSRIQAGYLLRLFKNEKIIEQLRRFCLEKSIYGAQLSGIGGILYAKIGHFDLDTQKYHFTEYTQTLEIVTLLGNVSKVNDAPFLHLHVTLADELNKMYGGHLNEAIVGGTCEILVMDFGKEILRVDDEQTNLKLLTLDNQTPV